MSSGFIIADVERIAALAHLELTAEEKQLFTHQLADILEYVRQCHRLIFSIRAPAPFATPWLPFAPHTDSDARGGPGYGAILGAFTSSLAVRYVERFNPVTRVPP